MENNKDNGYVWLPYITKTVKTTINDETVWYANKWKNLLLKIKHFFIKPKYLKNAHMHKNKMSKENKNLNEAENSALDIADVSTGTFRATLPLGMIWQPKEDITTYELAMCLPYFFRHDGVMPYEVDKSLPHFRHFKIIDHNVY